MEFKSFKFQQKTWNTETIMEMAILPKQRTIKNKMHKKMEN